MYAAMIIRESRLAKQMGGPPIFHDGFLKRVSIDERVMTLDIEILAQNNPLLEQDAMVRLELKDLQSLSLQAPECTNHIMVIHDLDIIRQDNQLLSLKLENKEGFVSEVVFAKLDIRKA